jgi:hypothetical protein
MKFMRKGEEENVSELKGNINSGQKYDNKHR